MNSQNTSLKNTVLTGKRMLEILETFKMRRTLSDANYAIK